MVPRTLATSFGNVDDVDPVADSTGGDPFTPVPPLPSSGAGEASLSTFWGKEPTRLQMAPLSDSEVKLYKIKLDPADFSRWLTEFKAFLCGRYPHASAIFETPYDAVPALLSSFPHAREANVWLANQLRALVDRSTSKGKILVLKFEKAESQFPGFMASGYQIANCICSVVDERKVDELERDYKAFKSREYLKRGMTADDVKIAVKRIELTMSVMPEHVRNASFATLRAIVDKMPSSPEALAATQFEYAGS